MDQRFGAGEERSSLFQASPSSSSRSSYAVRDGYFVAQALRAGYIWPLDGVHRVDLLPEPISAGEVLQRELLKQRIREEIIAREMPEMRLLEEEVRRELEVERALAMRRLRESSSSSVGGVLALAEARGSVASQCAAGVGVERRIVGVRPAGERPFGENGLGERLVGEGLLPSVPNGRLTKKLALPQSDHENKGSAFTSAHNANSPKDIVAGIKRKMNNSPGIAQTKSGELLGSAKCDWSCALCQVSASSREGLNEHLQGRKHRAKQALLGITKGAFGSCSATRADKPLTLAKGAGPKKAQTNPEGKNIFIKKTGPQPVKKQKTGTSLWCELCKLECSSNQMLASHLGGKKHRTRSEAAQRKAVAATDAAEKRTADVVPYNEVEKESKTASDSAEDRTGIVEGPMLEEKEPAGLEGAVSCIV